MAKEHFPLILIPLVLRGYDSEPTLSHIPLTLTAEVGQIVELTCHYSYEVEVVSSYVWYKQGVGEAPKAIDISSCNGADCKFISKKGNSKNILILEIRNVQANDSGSYYCAEMDSYAPLQKAANLLVGDSSTSKTAVLIFVPRWEENSRDTVPLVCLVSGISSNRIVIFWNISGMVAEGSSDPGTLEEDGTYSIISQIMVSMDMWSDDAVCTCIVQLGSPNKNWTKSVLFPKAAETRTEWCSRALPAFITVLVVLLLLLILLSIWICKGGRSGKLDNKSQNENLRETTQAVLRLKERHTGDHRQAQTQRLNDGALRSQGGPLYASLDLAALEKRSKKKAGRR
ncbi:immunoglobulin kappa light chain-like isoform X2 [Scyliorhinus canicula]|uniref:immunoglobulin kappa light chain-like isoform X2 n=1 Tax=Scyliorhinus canicula TaxID=7830 RepID=UPI0018F514DD|nr:immunoglobulin kappa light chain-like isoform X2 [Scyliorhinus canicula]